MSGCLAGYLHRIPREGMSPSSYRPKHGTRCAHRGRGFFFLHFLHFVLFFIFSFSCIFFFSYFPDVFFWFSWPLSLSKELRELHRLLLPDLVAHWWPIHQTRPIGRKNRWRGCPAVVGSGLEFVILDGILKELQQARSYGIAKSC